MIGRDSLAFALGWRLAGIIALLAVAALLGLVLHAQHIEADHPGNLVHDVLREFFVDMAWTIPLIALAAVGLAIWALRSGLRPVIGISAAARAIAPGQWAARLPVEAAPSEIRPLVEAMNGALDRLAEGYEAQRRFTATAAHELRTPLAVLRAGLERLPPSAEIEALQRDAMRMTRIVVQLLQLARLEGHAATGGTEELVSLVREMMADRAPAALAAGAALALDAHQPAVWVQGDRMRIEAIFGNLLDNAVAHSPQGSEVHVTISSDGTLMVRDTGPGIPEALQRRIFERFFRGEWTGAQGAGLGLTIAAEAAAAVGAKLWLQSTNKAGSSFVVGFCTKPAQA